MKKTSIWLTLGKPTFGRPWLATVISGSCIPAHNTAAYWTLNSLGASMVLIATFLFSACAQLATVKNVEPLPPAEGTISAGGVQTQRKQGGIQKLRFPEISIFVPRLGPT